MNRTVLALAALLAAAPGLPRAAGDEPFGMLSVEEVSSFLGSKGVAVFDANPPDLFARAHVPGARLLSYKDVSPQTLPSDKGTTLIFYCHNRKWMASHQAARRAAELGYAKVFVMPDGIDGWIAAGKPVEKG